MSYIPSYMPLEDTVNKCIGAGIGTRQVLRLVLGNLFALFLYGSCFFYLPAFGLAVYADEQYKKVASDMSYMLYTFLTWIIFTYQYFLLLGGVKFASPNSWELRATGFIMVTQPRTHMWMTYFGLFFSIISANQCITFFLLMRKFISPSSLDHDVQFKNILLIAHGLFSVLMAFYCLFRIVYDPRILRARKRFLQSREEGRRVPPPPMSVSAEGWPTIENGPQECTICTQRAANRQLRCGHIICCCCIARIANMKSCVTCPFCRVEVFNARKLLVEPEKTTVPLSHCDGCGCMEEGLKSEEERREEIEGMVDSRRASLESVENVRNGARALLLPMPEVTPNMGI